MNTKKAIVSGISYTFQECVHFMKAMQFGSTLNWVKLSCFCSFQCSCGTRQSEELWRLHILSLCPWSCVKMCFSAISSTKADYSIDLFLQKSINEFCGFWNKTYLNWVWYWSTSTSVCKCYFFHLVLVVFVLVFLLLLSLLSLLLWLLL